MEASVAAKPFAGVGRHLSHSQVNLFDRCQLAWYFRYVKGVDKPPTVPMLVGQCYHRALAYNFRQKLVTGEDLPPEEVVSYYCSAAGEALVPSSVHGYYAQDSDAVRDQGARLLDYYYRNYVVGRMEPVLVEHEFRSQIPGTDRSFVGIIDVQLTDGRMIDFKLTGRRWKDSDAGTDKQATAYAMLYGADLDFEYHIAIRGNKNPSVQIVQTRRTADDVREYVHFLHRALAQMEDIELGRTEPTLCTGFCNQKICQFWAECQEWKYGSQPPEQEFLPS